MTLLFRAEPTANRGVFLILADDTETLIAEVPAGHEPTAEQMIQIKASWFRSARYPAPIAAERYLAALQPQPARVVPSFVTRLPPELAFAEMAPVRAWDADR